MVPESLELGSCCHGIDLFLCALELSEWWPETTTNPSLPNFNILNTVGTRPKNVLIVVVLIIILYFIFLIRIIFVFNWIEFIFFFFGENWIYLILNPRRKKMQPTWTPIFLIIIRLMAAHNIDRRGYNVVLRCIFVLLEVYIKIDIKSIDPI